MKTPVSAGVTGRDVIAVVGKMSSRGQAGTFAYNFISLDHQLRAVGMFDHPFSPEQGDGSVGIIANCQIIDERMRSIRRELLAAMPVNELVQFNPQAGQFDGCSHQSVNRNEPAGEIHEKVKLEKGLSTCRGKQLLHKSKVHAKARAPFRQ